MTNITVTGNQAYFNEDAKFYKDVYVYGTIYYDWSKIKKLKLKELIVEDYFTVLGISSFYGPAFFYENVYFDKAINVGILTVRQRLDVGVGGTTLRANAETGKVGIANTSPQKELDVIGTAIISDKVGIGSIEPQQKLDVAGSVKIDVTIYDSANVPGKNGYFMTRDEGGLRWLPLVAENRPDFPGIATDGIFVLDEGVPLYPA